MQTVRLAAACCLGLALSGCGLAAQPAELGEQAGGQVVSVEGQALVPVPVSGTPGVVVVRGGDEQALRDLLGRALGYPGDAGGDTLILVSSLPDELPLGLPMPDDVRVLGSVVRGEPQGMELYLETDISSEAVLEFYARAMEDLGWTSPPSEQGGGFTSAPAFASTFCNDADGTIVWLSAFPTVEGATDLRLSLQSPQPYSPCSAAYGAGGMDPVATIIPSLSSPAGSVVQGGGMSSGGDQGDMSATVQTSLSAAALADHYRGQLVDQGWDLTGEGSGGEAAWSYWRMASQADRTWAGTLFVLRSTAVDDQVIAWFRVELIPGGD
jgi:hypothetical protein